MSTLGAHVGDFAHIPEDFGSEIYSRRIKSKAFAIYLLVIAAGLVPSVLDWNPHLQAFGLGLVFPGAGFLAGTGWALLLFPLSLLLVGAAFVITLLGMATAVPLVWLLCAIVSALVVGDPVNPWGALLAGACGAAFAGWLVWNGRTQRIRELALRETRAAYLPGELAALDRTAADAPEAGTREIDPETMAILRYAMDRGLQPVEAWNGFDVIEQFAADGLRYQLNYLLWALQLAQCHYTPSFHGDLNRAQRNLLDKMTVPKVWTWWRWENFWGNFSLDADPIAKDNIMFGGFSATNVALYTANTGDPHYLQDGSLTFRLNRKKAFRHSLKTMMAAGRWNHRHAVYAPMYPCEPNMTYSVCNLWGNYQFLIGDRIFGTDETRELLPKLRVGQVSEMLSADGMPIGGRVGFLGTRIISNPSKSTINVVCQWGWQAATFFPDLARRVWAILRKEVIRRDADGDAEVTITPFDKLDPANFKKHALHVYAHLLVMARELGDEDSAQALFRKVAKAYERMDRDGTTSYTKASTVTNALMAMARLLRRGDLKALHREGPPASCLHGPLLTDAAYPQVLVAKAWSHRGDDLELVLYPGTPLSLQRIGVGRLRTDRLYTLRIGDKERAFGADEQGRAVIEVTLNGRTHLMIEPR